MRLPACLQLHVNRTDPKAKNSHVNCIPLFGSGKEWRLQIFFSSYRDLATEVSQLGASLYWQPCDSTDNGDMWRGMVLITGDGAVRADESHLADHEVGPAYVALCVAVAVAVS
eukprot:139057-Rhodomonas_salina.1